MTWGAVRIMRTKTCAGTNARSAAKIGVISRLASVWTITSACVQIAFGMKGTRMAQTPNEIHANDMRRAHNWFVARRLIEEWTSDMAWGIENARGSLIDRIAAALDAKDKAAADGPKPEALPK